MATPLDCLHSVVKEAATLQSGLGAESILEKG